jgi:hypothetical protein
MSSRDWTGQPKANAHLSRHKPGHVLMALYGGVVSYLRNSTRALADLAVTVECDLSEAMQHCTRVGHLYMLHHMVESGVSDWLEHGDLHVVHPDVLHYLASPMEWNQPGDRCL